MKHCGDKDKKAKPGRPKKSMDQRAIAAMDAKMSEIKEKRSKESEERMKLYGE